MDIDTLEIYDRFPALLLVCGAAAQFVFPGPGIRSRLLGCVIVAMLLANLPGTSLYYRHLLETDLSLMVHSPDGLIDWISRAG
mgnify:CR=1 FL=1